MANMTSVGSDMVKLETIAGTKLIPSSERRTSFPVLVRVTAPQQCRQRHRLDLVVVVDTSDSMDYEGRLDCVKHAMEFVIDNLGDDDQLHIVPFMGAANDNLGRRLLKMSEENREELKTIVNLLKAGGGNDLGAADNAAEVLRDGGVEASSGIGRIIYLSGGAYTVTRVDPEFPTNTFGIGSGHRPETMKYISDQTSGVYSYVNKNLDKITDGFAQCIGGLTSVTAIDIKIELETHEGVSISSIESGSYQHNIRPGNQEGTIQINDLYAGEIKNFIVYLTIPAGKDELITVSGSYNSPNDIILLAGSKVVVKRPSAWACALAWASTRSNKVVHHEVATELARLQLVKGVSDMAKNGQFDMKNLQRLWVSVYGPNTPDQTMSEDEVKPYMLSWLTSHLSQRATTKGSPSESSDFQTRVMKNMLLIVGNKEPEPELKPEPQPPVQLELVDKLKTMWQKGVIWAKSNPCYWALPPVTLLLLGALLLIMYVSTHTTKRTTIIMEKNIHNRSSPLDVSNHPGWPKMDKALEVTMLRSMEEVGIVSWLNGASMEDMMYGTNRYLYLAIVHATALGSRCGSEDVATISQLEENIRSLKGQKNHLLAKSEALGKEKEELAVSAANCISGKETKEALQRANTRIAELEKQLQDKKAFADSLLSEVTNADTHLKTCGQRVDMLESKVREMEGVIVSQ